jgi:entericidin B
MKNTIALVFSLLASMIAVSACNTIEGMGKDIERGGRAIERAAK